MAMVSGSVSIDDAGAVTAVPNDATNCALAIYTALAASDDSDPPTTPQTTQTPPSVSFNPDGSLNYTAGTITTTDVPVTSIESDGGAARKKGYAKVANALAAALVPYLQANAQAKIPATAAGDALMRDSGGGNCQHPTTDKFIGIV